MKDCVFCKIIKREIPAYIINETDDVIVFLSLENHPLIVPKKHTPNIYSLDREAGCLLMEKTVEIANAVKAGLNCDGIYVTQANDSAGGQDVFHLHIHVYPKWLKKEKVLKEDEKSKKYRKDIVDKIKEALKINE